MLKFKGFKSPHYTQIPNEIIDEVMAKISPPEFKVLIYIARKTIGWHRDKDNISLNQIVGGITTHSGKRLDYGTGLGKSTVARCLNSLEDQGYIVRTRRKDNFDVALPTTFKLNFDNSE